MSVELKTAQLHAILKHATSAYPQEGCGLLVGRSENGRKIVEEIWVQENAHQEEGKYARYLIPPDAMLQEERRAEQKGLDIVGIFHSHPDHPERPSEFDREHAFPWYAYLITSVEHGHAAKTAAWRLADDRSGFENEELIVV